MTGPSIPIQIDSVKRLEGFQRTRCVYFRIDNASWIQSESLQFLRRTRNPILALFSRLLFRGKNSPLLWQSGDQGALAVPWRTWSVLVSPSQTIDKGGLFLSSDSIDRTFKEIGANQKLSMDTGHFWIPNELIKVGTEQEPRVGDIFRVSLEMFSACYRFIEGSMDEDAWLEFCRLNADGIRPSDRETEAFRQWRKEKVGQFKERHYASDYEGRRLKKKETGGSGNELS